MELSLATAAVLIFALWVGMSALISLFGWAQLAAAHPWPEERGSFEGERIRFQSVGFRRGPGYNGAVTFGVNDEGLYVALWLVLRVGHPPIWIPWSDIEGATERRAGLVQRVDLRFRRVPGVELRMTPRLARRLAELADGRFPPVESD